ncbi:MAG: CHRD domain-containing protein [Proteobacteria bacterium]|nr:CHRD domain-containing protein [Pseudomonadota bacterium]
MNTARRIMLGAALAGSLVALGACSSMMPGNTVKIGATLYAAAEVPPNDSKGKGTMEGTFNKDTRLLKWNVTYEGLTGPAMAAHFHGPAMAGSNAGVVVQFGPPVTSPIVGEATITPEQAADLLAGKWYVNVHTAQNKGGEIRGQVVIR